MWNSMQSSETVKDTVVLRFKWAKFTYTISYKQMVGIERNLAKVSPSDIYK